jgi:hypothetical protein
VSAVAARIERERREHDRREAAHAARMTPEARDALAEARWQLTRDLRRLSGRARGEAADEQERDDQGRFTGAGFDGGARQGAVPAREQTSSRNMSEALRRAWRKQFAMEED